VEALIKKGDKNIEDYQNTLAVQEGLLKLEKEFKNGRKVKQNYFKDFLTEELTQTVFEKASRPHYTLKLKEDKTNLLSFSDTECDGQGEAAEWGVSNS